MVRFFSRYFKGNNYLPREKKYHPGTKFTCLRCGHVWRNRFQGRPVACGGCKSVYWERPKRILVADMAQLRSCWSNMLRRCYIPTDQDFKNYGGRGIEVCARWQCSFEDFVADMGPKPTAYHSLDRIDNDGNYEPVNCKWSNASEQGRNRRSSRKSTGANR